MRPINEIPEYKTVADKLTEIQTEIIRNDRRHDEINADFSKPRRADSENAFAVYLTVEGAYAVNQKTELREELGHIETRQEFLRTALEQGRQELNRIRGQVSLTACGEARPRYVQAMRELLTGLRAICNANKRLNAIRDEIEENGFTSGPLPVATYNIGGQWSDPYGGPVVGYRQYVRENFPELTKECQ